MKSITRLRAALARWYDTNRRDLPWRRTRDPYKIWISEIMLQQTRVAAVIPYYERFLARFPTVETLAAAPPDQLLFAWAGLGYYSRARNLQEAAQSIVSKGGFPRDYEGIRALKGVGDYTAAAVASISFGLPHAVVDGNVLRVLSRIDRETGDIGATETRRRIAGRAAELLDHSDPARHNQAVMELGATICVPKDPACGKCPVSEWCEARAAGVQRELPIKARKMEMRRSERTLLVVQREGKILLWQRAEDSGKLAGFWELPEPHHLPEMVEGEGLHRFRHSIMNHIYTFQVQRAEVRRAPAGFKWISEKTLNLLPLSTTTRKALAGLRQATLFGI